MAGLAWPLPTPPSINPVTQTAGRTGRALQGAFADGFEALSPTPPTPGIKACKPHLIPGQAFCLQLAQEAGLGGPRGSWCRGRAAWPKGVPGWIPRALAWAARPQFAAEEWGVGSLQAPSPGLCAGGWSRVCDIEFAVSLGVGLSEGVPAAGLTRHIPQHLPSYGLGKP